MRKLRFVFSYQITDKEEQCWDCLDYHTTGTHHHWELVVIVHQTGANGGIIWQKNISILISRISRILKKISLLPQVLGCQRMQVSSIKYPYRIGPGIPPTSLATIVWSPTAIDFSSSLTLFRVVTRENKWKSVISRIQRIYHKTFFITCFVEKICY